MTGSGRKNGDVALVAGLAGGASVQEAARQARLSERTAYRRLEDPEFCHQVAEARRALIVRAVGTLARVASAAAVTLAQLLKAESESVRLGACRAILELAVRLRESEELEARIAALEDATAPGVREGIRRWG